jgi:hypothetical protein
MAVDRGEGGGKEPVEARKDGGVPNGLGGGDATRFKFVRKEAKNAVLTQPSSLSVVS